MYRYRIFSFYSRLLFHLYIQLLYKLICYSKIQIFPPIRYLNFETINVDSNLYSQCNHTFRLTPSHSAYSA